MEAHGPGVRGPRKEDPVVVVFFLQRNLELWLKEQAELLGALAAVVGLLGGGLWAKMGAWFKGPVRVGWY